MAEPIAIAGAGPAGLAAAIVLARAGRAVRVYERAPRVGARFHGDLQGIENWSRPADALAELAAAGIAITCPVTPIREARFAGPDRRLRSLRDAEPFFYMVRRGPGPDTLDTALYQQALAAGAEVRLGERLPPERADIAATGPAGTSGVALGYVFATDAPPTALLLLDQRLAPGGYAYLLAGGGRGTLATTFPLTSQASSPLKPPLPQGEGGGEGVGPRAYLEASLQAARALLAIEMREPRRFGGRGHFYLASRFQRGATRYAGEAAGLQDFFLGFGIRFALLSGALAARCLLEGLDYEQQVRARFQGAQRTAVVNRFLFERLGNRQLDWLAARAASAAAAPRDFLRRRYRISWKKRLLFPLARWRLGRRLSEVTP